MSTATDTSPVQRLRNLAASLRLSERDVDITSMLRDHSNNILAAESAMRRLATQQGGRQITTDARIRRCAGALARTPEALDILHSSLHKVLADPLTERLRKVNMTSGAFRDRVASKNPAATELLYSVGYEPMHGHLVLQKHDPAKLKLALDELDLAKALSTYREGKAAQLSEQTRRLAVSAEKAESAVRRESFLARVPAEPAADGASSACVVTVRAGGAASTRRFGSDNTLEDLVNFCRSLPAVPDVAAASDLVIENVTTRPARRLDPARQGRDSLYSLDLWPRGQVAVRLLEAARA